MSEPCHVKPNLTYEPRCEKTCLRGFRPGPTQTGLYSHRRWLKARNFVFTKYRDCTSYVAKTKALISFAVTAKLICALFSHMQKAGFLTTRLICEQQMADQPVHLYSLIKTSVVQYLCSTLHLASVSNMSSF